MQLPNFEFEQKLWKSGMKIIAGADEVGRGCFAGPVTAGCVVFSPRLQTDHLIKKKIVINDSKKMKPDQRESAAAWIKENSFAWGIGSASVKEINKLGISKAAQRAFRRAIKKTQNHVSKRIEFLFVDAFYIPNTNGLPIGKRQQDLNNIFESNSRQLAIKKGDSLSISIAAASIIAKVYRDQFMEELGSHKKYNKYGWKSNKGYGSKQHRNAIIEHGICSHHRTQFVETFLTNIASIEN